MTRKTKALSGSAQEAYFRRVLKTFPDLSEAAREAILGRLRQDVAQLRVRAGAREDSAAVQDSADTDAAEDAEAVGNHAAAASPDVSATHFDPFALNVIVTLRQQGRDAALEALNAIANAEHLRLLAREQRLSIDTALASSAELSAAIVTAAERRLANRRAAASAR
jgi:hypothetical protein